MTPEQHAEEINRRLVRSAAWARSDAASSFTPSPGQWIGLARLYRRAVREVETVTAGQPPMPETCQVTKGRRAAPEQDDADQYEGVSSVAR
jgi:hypothetical protein